MSKSVCYKKRHARYLPGMAFFYDFAGFFSKPWTQSEKW